MGETEHSKFPWFEVVAGSLAGLAGGAGLGYALGRQNKRTASAGMLTSARENPGRATTASAGHSSIGRVRKNNEDSWLVLPDQGLFLVADGMGGHNGGEVASRMAVDVTAEQVARLAHQAPENRLQLAFEAAHRAVLDRASSDIELDRMGTTLVALLLVGDHAYVAHVGDSRAYRMRDGQLRSLTKDHGMGHWLTQAIGHSSGMQPDLWTDSTRPGDLFLLCSDGLTKQVDDASILRDLLSSGTLDDTCHRLVDHADQAGGEDNTTVVLVRT